MANATLRDGTAPPWPAQAPAGDAGRMAAGAFLTVGCALSIVALPLVANDASMVLGLTTLAVMMIGCAILSPSVLIVTLFCGFLFQNTIVSILSSSIASKADFDMMRAYNFFAVCLAWGTVAVRLLRGHLPCPPALLPFLKVSICAMAVIGVYFLIGFAFFGMLAIVNLRNVATPLLLFQLCIVLFAGARLRIGPALTLVGLMLMFCGFAEFFLREDWLAVTNGLGYWDLAAGPNWMSLALDKQARETGMVAASLLDTFRITLFNSPLLSDLDIQMMRLFGPNMHAISFAYCTGFFLIFTLYRGRFLQATAFLALLILANAKGPVLVVLLSGVSWIVFQLFGSRLALALLTLLLALYAVSGIIVGLNIGDFHALGLMAGLQDFLANPVGRGIGAGGNLSPLFFTIDWSQAQASGRTPFPVESSVGTLLYQLGVAAFAVIGVYVWIAWKLLSMARLTRNALQAALSFAILALITNGLFQEEAYFSPLALATYLALAGMMLGAGIREGLFDDKETVKP